MEKQNKKKRIEKLKRKYRLVLMDAATFEEKVSFRVTRLGVFLSVATTIILLISLTVYLLAFTGLREYIPGYTDVTLPKKIYDLQQTSDSLERVFRQKDLYISNIKRIIQGDSVAEIAQPKQDAFINYDTITLSLSREDSLLRAEYEERFKALLKEGIESGVFRQVQVSFAMRLVFSTLNGIPTWYRPDGALTPDQISEQIADFLLEGLLRK